ncbi:GGDEF domain-containing protein, partial [Christensenellaceae bacterium OttesenSCG-928-M15]|nr:GGDEF domain-containing protein [Christensenellaceae bacterium OttesenSCG-928-M15]
IGLMSAMFLLCRLLFERSRELIDTAVSNTLLHMQLSHRLSLDSLTKLYNHATFYEKLDEHIKAHKTQNQPFALLVLDIDNFKAINDTYGHDVGDIVILRLVEIIKAHTTALELAFRYGGEEFTILTTDVIRAPRLAEDIRLALEDSRYKEFDRRVTVSIGLCQYNDNFGGRREYFAAADKALYNAKRTGKNRVCVHED